MTESQASLLSPVAKLDIKDLLGEGQPHPPRGTTVHHPSYSPSASVSSSRCQLPELPSPSCTATAPQYPGCTVPPIQLHGYHLRQSQALDAQSAQLSNTVQAVLQQNPAAAVASAKRPLPADGQPFGSPAKKQSKWSPAEDAEIIKLRNSAGMKWEDISKRLPGRSAISCRLHYQNYLEKRSRWDEQKRNKLARVYDRLKPEMWQPIAKELEVPWRAAEAMHWSMGEQEMARRANAVPFNHTVSRAESQEYGGGRVAQRDRMIESTRVFEGRDFSNLGSPPQILNSNLQSKISGPREPLISMDLPPIKNDDHQTDLGEDTVEDEEDGGGLRVRTRRTTGETRLPGFSQLEGEIQAFTGRRKTTQIKQEEDVVVRRGSESSGSSRRSSQ